ncbi:TPR-like protein [Exidia glandulosa HHB12029]|uniref:ER membrane protein complex subunit 2 n=1 Tax=Exidia glandulosa HHB12029 TaxID=1314781 RepID=A0A166AF75_EXIGL|nr:TPR-like protein [Exidia glandulosa HHB12029]
MSSVSFAEAQKRLANYRKHNTRSSEEVVQLGTKIIRGNGLKKMGDEAWAFLEQVALAALDIGQVELAYDCIAQLEERFPDSPRTTVLQGIVLESTGQYQKALLWYDAALEIDESNAAYWKRKIAVRRQMGETEKVVEELSAYLDTFYADADAWLELAEVYASVNQYTHALQCLSHVMLIAPQNPFYVLQAAETAYSAGDVPLAARYYLRVVELTEGDSRRAWFGVKLCARRLLNEANAANSASNTAVPKHLGELELLATEKLADAYSASKTGGEARGWTVVERWLSS